MRKPIGVLLVIIMSAACVIWAQTPSTEIKVDRAQLQAVEDLSESLANALLDLSIATRRMDLSKIAGYFAEEIDAEALPSLPGALSPGVKWIEVHAWEVEEKYRPKLSEEPAGKKRKKSKGKDDASIPKPDKSAFLAQLGALLGHFSEIEDARFKVKDATFPDPATPAGDAKLGFYIVGRDLDGRREWLRGVSYVSAARTGEAWRITKWRTESLKSDVTTKDLFSDVAEPAGIARAYPAFGVPPNDGFVAHGGAAGDVNGDGLLDLVLTEPDGNRLFLGDGKGSFEDASEKTLVKFAPPGTGALILDYDNDGDKDIFLSAVGNQVLLENYTDPNKIWTFRDVSEQAGVAVPAVGFSAAAADVNNDGRPDIYVASYNKYGAVMPNSWSRATNGTPNLLFINIGNGLFRESARQWRVDDGRWSYAAAFADVDIDGKQDLYVANDFGENALFMNKGQMFEDEALRRGVLDPGNGMGVAFGDADNDGDLDLHVTNMSSTAGNRILGRLMPGATPSTSVLKKLAAGNTLYQNRGNGYFDDVSEKAGYFSAGWAYGGGFLDFDNDGWEDEFSVNGFVSGSSMADT